MKKLTLLLSALMLVGLLNSHAGDGNCFEKGDVLLNPGISWGWRGGGDFFIPNISFSADFGVHDYVSVGPYVAAGFQKFGMDKYRYFAVGARGNFHWWQLLDDKVDADLEQDQLELYVTVWMGGEIGSIKFSGGAKSSSGNFDGGSSLGFRYYPKANDHFAIFTEWGRTPQGWATVGATIKL